MFILSQTVSQFVIYVSVYWSEGLPHGLCDFLGIGKGEAQNSFIYHSNLGI